MFSDHFHSRIIAKMMIMITSTNHNCHGAKSLTGECACKLKVSPLPLPFLHQLWLFQELQLNIKSPGCLSSLVWKSLEFHIFLRPEKLVIYQLPNFLFFSELEGLLVIMPTFCRYRCFSNRK